MFRLFSRYWLATAAVALVVDAGLLVVAATAAFLLRFSHGVGTFLSYGEVFMRVAVFCGIILVNLYANGLYDLRQLRSRRLLGIRILQAFTSSAAVLVLVYYLVPSVWTGRGVLAISFLLGFALLAGWRLLLAWLSINYLVSERVLIVGSDEAAQELAREILARQHVGYRVVGFVADDPALEGVSLINPRVLGQTERVCEVALAQEATRVVVAQMDNRGRVSLEGLLKCKTSGIPVDRSSDYYEQLTGKVMLDGPRVRSWLIFNPGFVVSRAALIAKLALDMVLAVVGLALAAPLVALAALAIWLETGPPIFYSQERVGKGGRIFRLWKLRTMHDDAESDGEAQWAQADDPRVTRVGRLLRRFRLDEVPQLFNVLLGEMSLVGPRPERAEFVEELSERFPLYKQRLAVRPGITGWAQVNAPYAASFEASKDKLAYDLYYIRNLSIFLDVSILASTLRAVLAGRGAR